MIMLVAMIVLHSATGVEIDLNEKLITNMRNPEPGNKLFSENVKCLVNMSDGKFVTVRETCEEVKAKIGRDK
jgi:uncharacterized protein YlzI (FlbEa/FlbD family)